MIRRLVAPIASLRLTVILFALSMFLIVTNTLAQVEQGIWEVVHGYFRSFIVTIPFNVFTVHFGMDAPGAIWFPGGFTLGGLMLINLIAAHVIRFKLTTNAGDLIIGGIGSAVGITIIAIAPFVSEVPQWTVVFEKFIGKSILGNFWPMLVMITTGVLVLIPPSYLLYKRRAGVVLLHAGIIVLLVGELVTAVYANEANMVIDEGSYADYTYNIRQIELAVIDPSDERQDRVTVVPATMLDEKGFTLSDDRLPFDITIDHWEPISKLIDLGAAKPGDVTEDEWQLAIKTQAEKKAKVAGVRVAIIPADKTTGVEAGQVDVPGAYVRLTTRDGDPLGTYLLHPTIDRGQPVRMGEKTYLIALRFKREYLAYRVHLNDFKHDKFLGTNKPRNFSSDVTVEDLRSGQTRRVLIKMNAPMRYDGQTFYQSSFLEDDTGTVLMVVRNPGWALPYIACLLVTGGMLAHFGDALYQFIGRALK